MVYGPKPSAAQPRNSITELARSPRSDLRVRAALVTIARETREDRHIASLAGSAEREANSPQSPHHGRQRSLPVQVEGRP